MLALQRMRYSYIDTFLGAYTVYLLAFMSLKMVSKARGAIPGAVIVLVASFPPIIV